MIRWRRLGIALVWLVLVFVSSGVQAELSILDYLSVRDGKDPQRKENLSLYLAGVLEGLLTFNELNHSINVHVLCVPQDVRIDLQSFRSDVDRVIEETRKEQADFMAYAQQANISVIGLTALNEKFPCPEAESMIKEDKNSKGTKESE